MSNMPMDRGNNVQALARLPHLNDQQLQQIAMNKSDPLSTFAIAALNSRQIQKQKMQAGLAANKPTVADQVLTNEQSQGLGAINPNQPQGQPQPQQVAQAPQPQQAPVQMAEGGVAALDTGDMYNEQNYAGGGIVAFDGGGLADSDAATDAYWAQSAQSDLDTPYLTPSYWYAKTEDLMHRNIFPNRIVGVDAKGKPVTERQKYGDDPYTRAWKTDKLAERDKWLGKKEADKAAAIAPPPGLGIPKPGTPYDMSDKDLLAASNDIRNNPLVKTGDSMFAPKQDQVGAFPQGAGVAKEPSKEDMINRLIANEGLKTATKDRSGLFDDLVKPTTGLAKSKADEFMSILGDDPQRAKIQTRLDKMEEDITKDKTMAPWMSLTKAGLAMAAGKSPFALQNIAMGGIEGIKDYTDKQKDLKDAEYKHFALTNEMAKADRAVKIAATQYGVQSVEHQEAQNNAAKLAKANYFVQKDINDINVGLKEKELNLSGMKILADIKYHDDYLTILKERIKAGDKAAEAKLFQVSSTMLKDFHNSRVYSKFLSDLDKEFKYKGGSTNPEYVGRIQQKDIEYLSNAKSGMGMDTGESAIKSYDDLINPK